MRILTEPLWAFGYTDHPIGNATWSINADAGKLGGGVSLLTVVQTIEDHKKEAEATIRMIYKVEGFNAIKDELIEQQQADYWKSAARDP